MLHLTVSVLQVAKAVEDDAFDGVKWQSLLILIAFVLVMCLINILVNSSFSVLLCLRNTYIKVMLLMVSLSYSKLQFISSSS